MNDQYGRIVTGPPQPPTALTEATAQRIATALERVIELLGQQAPPVPPHLWPAPPSTYPCPACGLIGEHSLHCSRHPMRIT